MMVSEMPPPDSSAQEAGDPEVSSRRASLDQVRPEDNPIDPPKSPASGSRREQTKESSTVWYAVGRSEGVGGASGHLRRAPYADGYGDGDNLVR